MTTRPPAPLRCTLSGNPCGTDTVDATRGNCPDPANNYRCAAALPAPLFERYKLIIETFRNHMTEEDFKEAMEELANKKGE